MEQAFTQIYTFIHRAEVLHQLLDVFCIILEAMLKTVAIGLARRNHNGCQTTERCNQQHQYEISGNQLPIIQHVLESGKHILGSIVQEKVPLYPIFLNVQARATPLRIDIACDNQFRPERIFFWIPIDSVVDYKVYT